ncbi:MAG: sugar nucleotide-binding protein [Gemmatimonadota bacterium]|nr:sugar nucleotide-binding protein [Gemmatimonadota bacterium]
MMGRVPPAIERIAASQSPLELWGGFECTINRVGASYFDQTELSGHRGRLGDLDRIASLGIQAIRYPVLWEHIAPRSIKDADWSWTDRALSRLRELGIKPIVGLLHHGSGPRHTSLVDPGFPDKFREFSARVAERYPWVEMVTPINEPLTTARFAGLYGLWYPHARDDRAFVRALLNQCLAIRASMGAFRAVNPNVRLVQTEDLGKTYSTPPLAYQAEFENERRWLTFDLLSGRVNREHPLIEYLTRNGAARAELEGLVENPCRPDVLGVNHYLTGERFLDARVELYPHSARGGNGVQQYADVEAVRALEHGVAGHAGLLAEAWQRFRAPLAITEVHLGCTREQQLRWLNEAWQSAEELRDEGCDIRAVTVWSLLGSRGWDSLLTRKDGVYEPGPFDTRSRVPRATALAAVARDLAVRGSSDHPALDGEGWWKTRSRLAYPSHRTAPQGRALRRQIHLRRPIVITGAGGTLGSAFVRICAARGLEHRALTRADFDISKPEAVGAVLGELEPWAIINAAGYVRVDDAERDTERCHRENTLGAVTLARACAERRIRMLAFSTDLVFDGEATTPYVEAAATGPLSVYGATKVAAESEMLALDRQPLIIRTSAFFGPWDSSNFLTMALSSIAAGIPVAAADDMIVSPTYVPDLVNTALDLLIDDERSIWHLANDGALTWSEFGQLGAEAAGLDPSLIVPKPAADLGLTARRPRYSALSSARGSLMPPLHDALRRYAADRRQNVVVAVAAAIG